MLQLLSSAKILEVASNVAYLWSWRGVLEHRVVAEDRPIQMVSHFNVKHISGVLPPSFAVDVHTVLTRVTANLFNQAFGSFPKHMYLSLPRYCCSPQPSFWKFSFNSGYLKRCKPEYSVVFEAKVPLKWAPTSISNIY